MFGRVTSEGLTRNVMTIFKGIMFGSNLRGGNGMAKGGISVPFLPLKSPKFCPSKLEGQGGIVIHFPSLSSLNLQSIQK